MGDHWLEPFICWLITVGIEHIIDGIAIGLAMGGPQLDDWIKLDGILDEDIV